MKGVVKLKLASLWWVFWEWHTPPPARHQSCDIEPKDGRSRKTWNESWCEKKPGLLSILLPLLSLSPPLLWKKIFCVNILSILSLNLSLSFYLDSHFLGELRSQTRLGRSKNDFFPLNSLNLSNLFYCFISQSFGTTWALCTIWLGLLGWLLRCDS